jgi:signal transduction histidine kinase
MFSNEIVSGVVFSTLVILLLIVGVILSFIISGRRRMKQQIELAETKLNFEREIRQVETEVTEHLMSQFANELHDNIGQLLTAMHIHVENQKLRYPELSEGFQPIEIYLAEVTQHLRLLSRTLNNDYLGHIGLLSSLQLEAERPRALKRFAVHLQADDGATGFDRNHELMVFRIFQEITQNALRHSQAKNLYISLTLDDGFELQVRDDGKGFKLSEIFSKGKGSGLHNIMKRCRLAGLDCTIDTELEKGCLYIIKKSSTLA